MIHPVEEQFNNRPEDEKLVMSYLAYGNSPYDLLSQYIDLLKECGKFDDFVKEVKKDVSDISTDLEKPDFVKEVIKQYDDLKYSINSPILE